MEPEENPGIEKGDEYNADEQTRGENDEHIKKANRRGSNVSFHSKISTSLEFNRKKPASELFRVQMRRESLVEKFTSSRWIITFLAFVAMSNQIINQQCMSLAIVCMVQNDSSLTGAYQNNMTLPVIADTSEDYYVDWNSEIQGVVLSAFFYGFPLTPFLSGYLSGKFGGKYVVLIATVLLCISNMLIPLCASKSPYFVVGLRAIGGICAGGVTSSAVHVNSLWAPITEKAQMITFIYSAQNIANILANTISGLACGIPVQGGWPFIFYIFGGVGLLCLIPWMVYVYDFPMQHPRVKEDEVAYIDRGRRESTSSKMPTPPWLKILLSGPFWAILVAHTTQVFVFTVMGTFLPIYMNEILHFSIAENGILSSLPFVGRFLGSVVSGYVADKIMVKEYLSVATLRKVFQLFGCVVSAPCLIVVSFLDADNRNVAVVLIILYWTIQSTTNSAFRVNPLDIAPRFVGILSGLTSSVASLAQLAAPIATSALTTSGTREEWQVVFFICVGVAVGGGIIFAIFASGEEQDWAKDKEINIVVDGTCATDDEEMFENKGFENDLNTKREADLANDLNIDNSIILRHSLTGDMDKDSDFGNHTTGTQVYQEQIFVKDQSEISNKLDDNLNYSTETSAITITKL